MSEPLYFKTREAFRDWLSHNCQSSEGVWLVFGKTKALVTVKAGEALEEALCFGWIDGQMKKLTASPTSSIFPRAERTANGPRKTRLWQKALKNAG